MGTCAASSEAYPLLTNVNENRFSLWRRKSHGAFSPRPQTRKHEGLSRNGPVDRVSGYRIATGACAAAQSDLALRARGDGAAPHRAGSPSREIQRRTRCPPDHQRSDLWPAGVELLGDLGGSRVPGPSRPRPPHRVVADLHPNRRLLYPRPRGNRLRRSTRPHVHGRRADRHALRHAGRRLEDGDRSPLLHDLDRHRRRWHRFVEL